MCESACVYVCVCVLHLRNGDLLVSVGNIVNKRCMFVYMMSVRGNDCVCLCVCE